MELCPRRHRSVVGTFGKRARLQQFQMASLTDCCKKTISYVFDKNPFNETTTNDVLGIFLPEKLGRSISDVGKPMHCSDLLLDAQCSHQCISIFCLFHTSAIAYNCVFISYVDMF